MRYRIRPVLHNASREDYDRLHAEFTKHKIFDTVVGNDGVTYILPPAEYVHVAAFDDAGRMRDFVSSLIKTATSKTFGVFVSTVGSSAWSGLDAATPENVKAKSALIAKMYPSRHPYAS